MQNFCTRSSQAKACATLFQRAKSHFFKFSRPILSPSTTCFSIISNSGSGLRVDLTQRELVCAHIRRFHMLLRQNLPESVPTQKGETSPVLILYRSSHRPSRTRGADERNLFLDFELRREPGRLHVVDEIEATDAREGDSIGTYLRARRVGVRPFRLPV